LFRVKEVDGAGVAVVSASATVGEAISPPTSPANRETQNLRGDVAANPDPNFGSRGALATTGFELRL
jgi:hypothetical protein